MATTGLLALLAVLAASVVVATSPVPPSNASQFAPGLPSAPTITSVVGGDRQLSVAFDPPVSAVAVVTYQYSTDGGATWRVRTDGGSTASALVVTMDSATGVLLVNGTSYVVRVRAVSSVGAGFASNAVAGTPVGSAAVPGAPTAVVAWPTFAAAVVNWTPPPFDGGSPITSYVATASPGGATCVVSAPGTWCTIADLSNSSQYTVTVRAVNAVGTGPPSPPSGPVTPAPLPGQPTNVVGVAGDGVVAVSWTPSDEDRGPPVRRFTATADPGGAQCTVNAPATTCTVTGLVNQTAYRFSVVATNNTGNGPPSQPSAPVVPTAATSPMAMPSSAVDGASGGISDGGTGGATAGPIGPESPATGPGLLVWDPTPATVTLGQVMIVTTPTSEGAGTESGGVVTPDAGTGVTQPGSGSWSAGTAEVEVEVEVNTARGLAAWCWALGGIEGYSVMLFISQASGAVVIPGGWSAGSGPAAGLGSLGHSTVARFTVSVPTDLSVGRHRVGGSCVDPAGRVVGPGLTGTLDVVAAPPDSR